MMKYADVIVPLSVGGVFTYKIPPDFDVLPQIGARVEVSFRNKLYTGIVKRVHNELPDYPNIKPIINLIDQVPLLSKQHIQLWQWLAAYYMCFEGDVMNYALPTHLKLDSETIVIKNEDQTIDLAVLSDEEYLLMEALDKTGQLLISEVQQILQQKHTRKVLNKLSERGCISMHERSKDKYSPIFEKYVSLHPDYENEERLQNLFQQIEKSPKQLQLLLSYLHLSATQQVITVKQLLEDSKISMAILKTLTEKSIFVIDKKRVYRKLKGAHSTQQQFRLSEVQEKAMQEIQQHFSGKKNVLLHGITGSGKTNIYIELAKQQIAQGKQVLYLLPEIALTTQLSLRLQAHFQEDLGVYHSKYSDNERVDIWQRVGQNDLKLIVGSRSALFLPFKNLGLIIIDEEHDTSFKQEMTPRYHARDGALMLAHLLKIPVLLGSATPSFESLWNVEQQKLALVALYRRYEDITPPEIVIIPGADATQKTKSKLFTDALLHEMADSLQSKRQIIVFQNRRGYAPYLYCASCGWNAQCSSCAVALSYHKSTDKLHCHLCANQYKVPTTCPQCSSNKLYHKSFGTEKVEDELLQLFPKARVARLDTDVARTRKKMEQIIASVAGKGTDILVGTQMVVKGLDFEHVKLVCVLSAESLLTFADFRVNEKAVQTLIQVAGRAGRKHEQGRVCIQSNRPDNPLFNYIIQNDYIGFYRSEIVHRKAFHYPPFVKLLRVSLKHKEQYLVQDAAVQLHRLLQSLEHAALLGPAEPTINKIMNKYIQEILIKTSRDSRSLVKVKEQLATLINTLTADRRFAYVQVTVDVDPA